MIFYPQDMPIAYQLETGAARVTIGRTHGQARGPFWLCVGSVRPADEIAALHRDADALDRLFAGCPARQWGAAAQAGMSPTIAKEALK